MIKKKIVLKFNNKQIIKDLYFFLFHKSLQIAFLISYFEYIKKIVDKSINQF